MITTVIKKVDSDKLSKVDSIVLGKRRKVTVFIIFYFIKLFFKVTGNTGTLNSSLGRNDLLGHMRQIYRGWGHPC